MPAGDTRIARRYATALFRVAVGRNEVDEVAQSLAAVHKVTTTSGDLMSMLHHPRITRERKKEVLHQVFEGQLRPDVEHFLFLLVEKDRASIIPNMAAEFERLLDEYRRVTDAEAVTAVPLTEAQTQALKTRLETSTGYTVRLQTRVDEAIIGGMIVRVGDRLVDGSVRSQLTSMREQLKRARISF
jgi:F-type H+-transporting ATPase subunit delta